MDIKKTPLSFFLLIILFFIHNFCFAIDTISSAEVIRDSDSDTITSLNETFKLGFFSPGNSSNRYVGIWFSTLPGDIAIVWVANRDNPLADSSGVLRISSDGNLVVLDGRQKVVWTTNVSVGTNSSRAELMESGNLVLREVDSRGSNVGNTGRILWQSFEHPTHTLLQDMKFGANVRTGEKEIITSWKTDSDPSEGRFHMELEPLNIPQFVLWSGSQRHWRSGPWGGNTFLGVEGMSNLFLNGFSVNRADQEGYVFALLSYVKKPLFVRYVLNSIGRIAETRFDEGENRWVEDWSAPLTQCDFYGKCGSFGFCNLLSSPICSCLKGYEPKSIEEWNNGNWSSGCFRSSPLQCERNNTNSDEGKDDGFLKHEKMKVPDFVNSERAPDMEE
ncbi:hypothetical protein IFM89_004682 [Coptis chinensis]|uniref:Bulb-type lectin domain-containing protein n=1 Tax=Coptis chinensis TaxID=261450 RepID=A0A835GUB5_9MAGN|nr:hypothetical protein IFM89_004682 [Coptis chinensis]